MTKACPVAVYAEEVQKLIGLVLQVVDEFAGGCCSIVRAPLRSDFYSLWVLSATTNMAQELHRFQLTHKPVRGGAGICHLISDEHSHAVSMAGQLLKVVENLLAQKSGYSAGSQLVC
jgi:hypothetical protein